jgi:hypothetical protein
VYVTAVYCTFCNFCMWRSAEMIMLEVVRMPAIAPGDEREARVCLSAQAGDCRWGAISPLCWGSGAKPQSSGVMGIIKQHLMHIKQSFC